MKKLYTTLIALLVASTVFAQVERTPVAKDAGDFWKLPNVQKLPVKAKKDAKGSATFTFNFIDNVYEYYGIEASVENDYWYPTSVIDANSGVQYENEETVRAVSIGAIGQVFDFYPVVYNHWATCLSGPTFNAPNLSTATSYSIDSVQVAFMYFQGSEVPDNFVDTLVISYIVGLENDGVNYFPGDFPVWDGFTAAWAGFCPNIDLDNYGFHPDSTNGTVYTEKFLLTANDMTEGFGPYTFPTPSELRNVTKKIVAVYYGFIPGTVEGERDTLTAVMGENVNWFRPLFFKNSYMPGYSANPITGDGSAELATDFNTPLFTDLDGTFNEDDEYGWHKTMKPTRMFTSIYPYPYIGLTITCNDCDMLSVKDIEKKNITVRPNPATNQFTVDLDGEGTAQLQLFNLVGQLVYSDVTGNASATVNVSNLNSGVYVLKITQNGKVYTSKVVVR